MSEQRQKIIPVKNFNGDVIDNYLVPDCFNREVNLFLLKEVVEYYRNKKRLGNAKTKTRSDLINVSNRKVYRQKGSGRARIGDKTSPHLRGGAVAFGPNGRIYQYTIPKKKISAVLQMVLSSKLADDRLILLDKFDFPEIKTKKFLESASKLGLESGLFITNHDINLEKSLRNLPCFSYLNINSLNVLSIVSNKFLVLDFATLKKLEERFKEDIQGATNE